MSRKDDVSLDRPADQAVVVREATHPYLDFETNNFDALRLGAALLVLYSHQFFFLGQPQPSLAGTTLGEIAVMIFFVISGYLVAESWYRDPHIVRFTTRRLLRLWPALAVATIAIVLACAVITTLPWHDFWVGGARHFVTRNLQLRASYQLPGVFAAQPGNPSLSAVNGSWWTIPLEAKCYGYLAALGLIGLRRRWLSTLVLGLVAFQYLRTLPGGRTADAHQNLSLLYIGFFMAGVCARQFRNELMRFPIRWLGAGAGVLVLALTTGRLGLAEWVVIAPATLLLGSLSTPLLRDAGRFGDLSYGIYLYAYFVQQLTTRFWLATPTLATSLFVSVSVTVVLAWCSWHAVEAPALGLKRHLRQWFPDQAV